MHPGEQLVNDLDRRALTDVLAAAVHLARDRIQHRLQLGERRIITGCHHRHLACGCFRRATGDRRIQHQQTARGERLAKTAGILRGNRRRNHHRRAGLELVSELALAEKHGLHLRGIDHEQQHRVELVGKTIRRCRDRFRTGSLQNVARLRRQIHAIRIKTGAHTGLRRPHTHRTQTDYRNCIRHDEPLVM